MGYFSCSVASTQVCMLFVEGHSYSRVLGDLLVGKRASLLLVSLQHEKYTSQLQMNYKGTAMKRAEQPMEHGVYTESPQAKLEKGERKAITGTCLGTSSSGFWAKCSLSPVLGYDSDSLVGCIWEQFWKDHLSKLVEYSRLGFWRLSLQKKSSWCDGSYMPCRCVCSGKSVGRAGLVSSLAPAWSIFNFLIVSWCLNREGDSE